MCACMLRERVKLLPLYHTHRCHSKAMLGDFCHGLKSKSGYVGPIVHPNSMKTQLQTGHKFQTCKSDNETHLDARQS